MAQLAAMPMTVDKAGTSRSSRRPLPEAGLALVAVLGLGFAGYSLVGLMRGPGYQSVEVDEIRSILPVQSAKKLGTDLNVVLSDDSWLEQPAEALTGDLRKALTSLKQNKIEVLIVQDSSGKMRASAQWVNTAEGIQVRLH